MANGPNDTDPQSPRALANRTDPGLGEPAVLGPRRSSRPGDLSATPPPAVPTPSPGSASIEELLDGITGPRPAPARRDAAPGSTRAYASARHAPASQRMPPREPLVVSPAPPRASDTEPEAVRALSGQASGQPPSGGDAPPRVDPASTRPVVRRAEERTVYTGRRALIRNLSVALGSSIVVGLAMLTIMRWREAPRAAVVSSAPAATAAEPELDTRTDPAAGSEGLPVVRETSAPASVAMTPAPTANEKESSATRPATAAKRPKPKPVAAPPDSLDDLNRKIRH